MLKTAQIQLNSTNNLNKLLLLLQRTNKSLHRVNFFFALLMEHRQIPIHISECQSLATSAKYT